MDYDYEFIELFSQANVDEDLVESVVEGTIYEFDVYDEQIVQELIDHFNSLAVKANELGLFHLVVPGLPSQVQRKIDLALLFDLVPQLVDEVLFALEARVSVLLVQSLALVGRCLHHLEGRGTIPRRDDLRVMAWWFSGHVL